MRIIKVAVLTRSYREFKMWLSVDAKDYQKHDYIPVLSINDIRGRTFDRYIALWRSEENGRLEGVYDYIRQMNIVHGIEDLRLPDKIK